MDDEYLPVVDLREEEIAEAQRLSVREKLALGGDLFDLACEVMISGIRMQNPLYSDSEIRAEVDRRLTLGRKLEARG